MGLAKNEDYLDLNYPNVRAILIHEQIPIRVNGAIILGSVVGNDDNIMCNLITNHLNENHTNVFKCLNHENLPTQYAMLLLRLCALPKLNYILRTVRPSAITKLTEKFNQNILDTALNILKLQHVPESIMPRSTILQQLQLPYRHGGFGLNNVQTISHFAFLDSISQCLQLDFNTHKLFYTPSNTLAVALSTSIDFTIQHTRIDTHKHADVLPPSFELFMSHYHTRNPPAYIHSLQKLFTDEAHKQTSTALCNNFSNSVFHTARLKCITAQGATLWKSSIPTDSLSKLKNID